MKIRLLRLFLSFSAITLPFATPDVFAAQSLDSLQAKVAKTKSYRISTLKKLGAKEIYVFKSESPDKPSEGDSLLLARDGKLFTAVKVLKVVKAKHMFAGRVDTRYAATGFVSVGESYGAYNDPNPSSGGRSVSSMESTATISRPSHFIFSPGLGFSSFSYTETSKSPYSMIAANVNAKVGYQFTPKFEAIVDALITAAPLARSNLLVDTASARYINIDVLGGFHFNPSGKLVFSLYGGWLYRTTLFSGLTGDAQEGFQNATGLTVFPKLTWHMGARNALYLLAYYAPVLNGLKPLSGSHEFGFGLGWEKPHFFLRFDLTSLAFTLTSDQTVPTSITASQTGLTAGYTF